MNNISKLHFITFFNISFKLNYKITKNFILETIWSYIKQ
nr:MAG TPA: hypothetical protein [Caudoviricetes sp.]